MKKAGKFAYRSRNMEAVSVVVVGFGDRAVAYTKYALAHPDRLKVRAVIDPNPFRRDRKSVV